MSVTLWLARVIVGIAGLCITIALVDLVWSAIDESLAVSLFARLVLGIVMLCTVVAMVSLVVNTEIAVYQQAGLVWVIWPWIAVGVIMWAIYYAYY